MLQGQQQPRAQIMTSGLAILAIGFFLGMRHATDPDHVIAVSTIVSRERSIAKAAFIGVLWGLGHTLTILAVGAAIVLFGLAIPTRVGIASPNRTMAAPTDPKSTRLNSSHANISYAVFCLKKKKNKTTLNKLITCHG